MVEDFELTKEELTKEELTKEELTEEDLTKEELIKEQLTKEEQIEDVNYKSAAIFLISSSIPLLKSVSIVQPNCLTFSLLI